MCIWMGPSMLQQRFQFTAKLLLGLLIVAAAAWQALKAATIEPAAMLGMEKSLGAVAPGFYADIVAVEGDPLANISAVSRRENISWVMKSGRVVVDKTRATGP